MANSRPALRIITLLENNPYPRDVRVRPHMEALAGAGYQATVICPRDQGQKWTELINGVRVYRFPPLPAGGRAALYFVEFSWATLVMTILTLWIWMRHGLDVLHIYNPPETLFVAGLLPKLMGKTIVYDLRDISPEVYQSKFEHSSKILFALLVWMEGMMCRMADRIIAVNESYCNRLVARHDLAPGRISVVRQAPDLKQVHPTDPDLALRSRAGTIIAYMGSMAVQDGIDHLLAALSHLRRQFNREDWLCALVGPAEDQQGLEALAARLGVSDRTWFSRGFMPLEQWLPILSAADICVEPCPANPVNNISTMNKIMDYMALGKPTVAYDLHEHRVTAGEAALYALPNDKVDFARQIVRLMDDEALCSRLGAIGRRRMEQQFAWPYQKQRLLDVYANLGHQHVSVQPNAGR